MKSCPAPQTTLTRFSFGYCTFKLFESETLFESVLKVFDNLHFFVNDNVFILDEWPFLLY